MPKADVRIDVEYRFYSEYIIGGGKGVGNMHNYILRDVFGRPYIPASLIKGNVLHSAIILKSHFPKTDITGLFGGEGNDKGALYFDHALLAGWHLDSTAKEALMIERSISKRTGVTISRMMKNKREGMLRTVETSGQSGTMMFIAEIQGFIAEPIISIPLLIAAIRFPIALGGSKSRGLGWLAGTPFCNIKVDGRSIDNETLWKWLKEAS